MLIPVLLPAPFIRAQPTDRTGVERDALPSAAAVNRRGLSPDLDDDTSTGRLRRAETGIEYTSESERSAVHLWLRTQFRYSDPFDDDPQSASDLAAPPGGDLALNRARVKAEGHVLSRKAGFYYEHELAGGGRLLDLRADLTFRENLRLRIGQYKVLYNRERVDSSGAQQFVERSIMTRPFTLDRQRGITVGGRVGAERAFDSWYFVGVFEGDGRDPDDTGGEGDGRMWVGRYQWNFTDVPLPYSQSDFDFKQTPAGSLAFAVAKFEGPYTRFSSEGGGQLDGFEAGTGDRYRIEQWLQEFAWQFNGFSVQQEYHRKRVEDTSTGTITKLSGGYAQVGKAWPWTPDERTLPVELALRVAEVDPDRARGADEQREATVAVNLFFAGHENKLTLDVSRLALEQQNGPTLRDTRWRLQWDVSF